MVHSHFDSETQSFIWTSINRTLDMRAKFKSRIKI